MAYRKSLSKSSSRKKFRKSTGSKKINHVTRMGARGGIRL